MSGGDYIRVREASSGYEIPAMHAGLHLDAPDWISEAGMSPRARVRRQQERAREKDQAAGVKRAWGLIEQEQLRRSWARYQEEDCTCDEAPGTHTGDCPLAEQLTPAPAGSGKVPYRDAEPSPVTAETIRAAIFEPLGLGDEALPAYGTAPDGTCVRCLTGAAVRHRGAGDLCSYCLTLDRLRDSAPTRNSQRAEARAAKPGNPGTRNGPHRERLPGHSRCECTPCRESRAVRRSGIVMMLSVILAWAALVIFLAKAGVL